MLGVVCPRVPACPRVPRPRLTFDHSRLLLVFLSNGTSKELWETVLAPKSDEQDGGRSL